MSATETLRARPVLAIGVVIALLGGAAVVSYVSLSGSGARPPAGPGQVFFTTDEGATLFPDSAEKTPPFVKDGREAVRAHVVSPDGGKTRRVAYLSRLSPDAGRRLAAIQPSPAAEMQRAEIRQAGTEIKRMGEGKWVPLGSPEAAAILRELPVNAEGNVVELTP